LWDTWVVIDRVPSRRSVPLSVGLTALSTNRLAVIIEQSLGRWSVLADTATVTYRPGTLDVDASARNGDFHWPPVGHLVATSGTFSWPWTQVV
jgi:hypothetical protein